MVLIDSLIAEGLRCPNCDGVQIRSCYHDFQRMNSFICEICGLHWQEDMNDLLKYSWMFKERRFIWVMTDTEYPLKPILNPQTADEKHDRNSFVKKGVSYTIEGNRRKRR